MSVPSTKCQKFQNLKLFKIGIILVCTSWISLVFVLVINGDMGN